MRNCRRGVECDKAAIACGFVLEADRKPDEACPGRHALGALNL